MHRGFKCDIKRVWLYYETGQSSEQNLPLVEASCHHAWAERQCRMIKPRFDKTKVAVDATCSTLAAAMQWYIWLKHLPLIWARWWWMRVYGKMANWVRSHTHTHRAVLAGLAESDGRPMKGLWATQPWKGCLQTASDVPNMTNLGFTEDTPFTTVRESRHKHIYKQQRATQQTAVHFLVFIAWIYGSQTDGDEVGQNSDMWTRAADTMYTAHTDTQLTSNQWF